MAKSEQLAHNRKVIPCPSAKEMTVPELIQNCPRRIPYLLYCGSYNNRFYALPQSHQPDIPRQFLPIVFTDGACTNNGRPGAKAGAGVAYGSSADCQLHIPITDLNDNFPLRSNQRAELIAAIIGLETLAEAVATSHEEPTGRTKDDSWIIATDSEYVAKGMSEWLPAWKRNNWYTSKGTKPANLDLFLALDREIAKHKAKNVKIVIWRIPREQNELADRLAKAAADFGDVANTYAQSGPCPLPHSTPSGIQTQDFAMW